MASAKSHVPAIMKCLGLGLVAMGLGLECVGLGLVLGLEALSLKSKSAHRIVIFGIQMSHI